MGKKILSKQDVEKCYYGGSKSMIVSRNLIIPPGVMDLARSLGIKFIYVETSEFPNIVSALCAEYGVKDKSVVDEIVKRVIKLFEGERVKKVELEG
ncbi:MAG: hypothetical protein N3C62_03315 [Synergistetes bacterium]|nr:hypothetical protein [Synergistota bacterium]MCX8127760.1 hypothetical protein [Synergistota bacterium]MDW8191324.1 hypothetical protein [Synergistota bacterium]